MLLKCCYRLCVNVPTSNCQLFLKLFCPAVFPLASLGVWSWLADSMRICSQHVVEVLLSTVRECPNFELRNVFEIVSPTKRILLQVCLLGSPLSPYWPAYALSQMFGCMQSEERRKEREENKIDGESLQGG